MRPACATISASRPTFSGFAFSSSCFTPRRLSICDSFSLRSTSFVPMRIGRPLLLRSTTSLTTASHFSFSVRYTKSRCSTRSIGLFVGMATTSSL